MQVVQAGEEERRIGTCSTLIKHLPCSQLVGCFCYKGKNDVEKCEQSKSSFSISWPVLMYDGFNDSIWETFSTSVKTSLFCL